MNEDYKIVLDSISHGYGSKAVLNGISLRVRQGEILSLVGPSGCGKSTLFRIMLGEETPRSGTVYIGGKRKEGPSPDVGIVYQHYTLFPHLTVLQNIAYGPLVKATSIPGRMIGRLFSNHRKVLSAIHEESQGYLEMVKLVDAWNKYPHELSGGMRQRVAIAQALIMNPSVILMDEPFGALDPFTREELQLDLVRISQRTNMTILFVTHDLEEAVFLGTRIIVLSQHYQLSEGLQPEGSKIVMDLPLKTPHPRKAEFKESPELNTILERIRRSPALKNRPDKAQLALKEFALEHADSIPVV